MNEQQTSIEANIAILRVIAAYLLARDSIATQVPLDSLHEALVGEFAEFTINLKTDASLFGAKCEAGLDDIFSLAAVMARRAAG